VPSRISGGSARALPCRFQSRTPSVAMGAGKEIGITSTAMNAERGETAAAGRPPIRFSPQTRKAAPPLWITAKANRRASISRLDWWICKGQETPQLGRILDGLLPSAAPLGSPARFSLRVRPLQLEQTPRVHCPWTDHALHPHQLRICGHFQRGQNFQGSGGRNSLLP